jgi:hypothetical protein
MHHEPDSKQQIANEIIAEHLASRPAWSIESVNRW